LRSADAVASSRGRGLDDDHVATATRTSKCGRRWLAIYSTSMLSLRLWDREQLAGARDVIGTGRFGKQAEVAILLA
jgi:hypothetical protein